MMGTKSIAALLTVGIAAFAGVAAAQTTYTWNGTTSDYAVATNWTPTRTTPAVDDILVVDGAVTAAADITNLTAETIGKLVLQNNAVTTLSAVAARTLTIAGGTGTDLDVPAGSSLAYRGGFAITIALGASATGVVGGDVIFTSTGATIPHRLTAASADGLIFQNASSFQFAPGGSGAGNPYGTTSLNSVRFQSGSTFYMGGTKTGPSVGTGSNPFGATAPNSVLVMDAGSMFYNWTSVISAAGRTYGNLTIDNRGAQMAPGGSTSWVVLGNMLVKSTSVGNIQFDGAANPLLRVDGNFTLEANAPMQDTVGGADPAVGTSAIEVKGNLLLNSSNLTIQQTAIRPYVLTGTGTQDVSLATGKAFFGLTVDNSAGARLLSNVTANGIITLTNGEVNTNGFTLTGADGAANVVRTNGFVRGTLVRNINAATTGLRSFPVGTAGAYAGVDVDITVAGTGTGTLAVSSTAGDHPNVASATGALDRFWTLSPTGIDISAGAATLAFSYPAGDVTGSVVEASMAAGRLSGGVWQVFPNPASTSVNTGSHVATVTGVTGFSDWTLGNQIDLPVHLSALSIE
jgi:hypothetical protein